MANKHRGEVSAVLDGKPHTLVLTLGSLANLEDAFGGTDILSIAQKLQGGRLCANDCIRIITAGLRGAGENIDEEAVASMRTEGGAAGYVRIVADLMSATFSTSTGVSGENDSSSATPEK